MEPTSKDGEGVELGGGLAAGVEQAADGLAPQRGNVQRHVALAQVLAAQLPADGGRALHRGHARLQGRALQLRLRWSPPRMGYNTVLTFEGSLAWICI